MREPEEAALVVPNHHLLRKAGPRSMALSLDSMRKPLVLLSKSRWMIDVQRPEQQRPRPDLLAESEIETVAVASLDRRHLEFDSNPLMYHRSH